MQLIIYLLVGVLVFVLLWWLITLLGAAIAKGAPAPSPLSWIPLILQVLLILFAIFWLLNIVGIAGDPLYLNFGRRR